MEDACTVPFCCLCLSLFLLLSDLGVLFLFFGFSRVWWEAGSGSGAG